MRKYVNFNKLAWNRLIIRQYSQNNNKVSIKKDENDSSVTIRYRFYLTASKENKKFLENEFKINEDTIAKDVSNKIIKKLLQEDQIKETSAKSKIIIRDTTSNAIGDMNSFQMTTDSTILLNQNKNLADLLTERKIDFTKDDIKIKSLNINEESIVSDTKEVLEIDLGNIKSIPTTKNFIKEKDLEALDNLNEYDYTVSLIGRKLEEDENFHTRNYCQYQTY